MGVPGTTRKRTFCAMVASSSAASISANEPPMQRRGWALQKSIDKAVSRVLRKAPILGNSPLPQAELALCCNSDSNRTDWRCSERRLSASPRPEIQSRWLTVDPNV